MLNIETIRAIPTGIRQSIREQLLEQEFDNSYCKKCGLYKNAVNPYIEGRGNKDSKLLIVGESPGANEDKEGAPFVGKAGQILQTRLNRFGIDCFITNAVSCRSMDADGKNKTPVPTNIKCCNPFTVKLIKEIQPRVILTLGKIAMDQILNNLNINIGVVRGKQFYHPEYNAIIIPTYHPMYLGYAQDKLFYNQFEDDILLAHKLSHEPATRFLPSCPMSLKDPIEIENYLKSLLHVPVFSWDLETDGLDPTKNKITDISFCKEIGIGVHVSWKDMLPFFELLKEVMENSSSIKVLHNASFDVGFLRVLGIYPQNVSFDTMLAEHTLTMSVEGSQTKGLYRLKTLAWFYTPLGGYEDVLGEGGIVEAQQKKKLKLTVKKKKEVEDTPPSELDLLANLVVDSKLKKLEDTGLDRVAYYSALDSDVTFRVYQKQKSLIQEKYKNVFYDIIMPLNAVLLIMQENGIKFDIYYMEEVKKENNIAAQEKAQEFFDKVKEEFDINSSKQLNEIVFKKLKIKPDDRFKTPKGAPSLNEEALNFYKDKYPILENILEYRKIQKQTSTYIDGFRKYINDETWRAHPSYLQHSTASGRLSVVNPPIQTIPRDNRIRNMVIADDDKVLIIADLGQIELRMLAMIAQDHRMIKAFETGLDLHTATACNIFNIDPEDFDKTNPKHSELRSYAKTINFGIVYLMSPNALAQQLDLSIDDAETFIKKFYQAYPNIKIWTDSVIRMAHEQKYVETIFGRRRYLPFIDSGVMYERGKAERQAVNTIIQGSAADINNIALIRFQKWIEKSQSKSKLIACVHDSIIVETPREEIEVVQFELNKCLTENMPNITIPLVADIEVMERWKK